MSGIAYTNGGQASPVCCVVFDFDGTLVRSNAIKVEGFNVTCRNILGADAAAALAAARQAVPHADRHMLFAAVVRQLDVTGARARSLAARLTKEYSDYCRHEIAQCAEVAGATEALKTLSSAGMSLFVNSATPREPLVRSVTDRDFGTYLSGIYGGPQGKEANLRAIATQNGLEFEEIMVVGDGMDDWDSASTCGAHFVGIIDPYRAASGTALPQAGSDIVCIDDLSSFTPDAVARWSQTTVEVHSGTVSS